MDNFLEARSVYKSYGAEKACIDANLSIRKGELFYLLGPSGCGKSTLLGVIGGLIKPDRGEIILNGGDISCVPAEKRPINTIFQNYALFPHLNVFENVAFGLRLKRYPEEIIQLNVSEMLSTVSMSDFKYRMPHELSGGQQQRVAIARALVNEPKVLLLDEPFAALDAKLRRQMQLELKSLQHELKMTFICVTHDQGEALSMADRIAVMNKGKILQVGTPEEIYNSPIDSFVGSFIGDANIYNNSLIRPEKIKLSTSSPNTNNYFFGTIIERSFLGSSMLYLVKTKDREFKVLVPQIEQNLNLDIGTSVFIWWDSKDLKAVQNEF